MHSVCSASRESHDEHAPQAQRTPCADRLAPRRRAHGMLHSHHRVALLDVTAPLVHARIRPDRSPSLPACWRDP